MYLREGQESRRTPLPGEQTTPHILHWMVEVGSLNRPTQRLRHALFGDIKVSFKTRTALSMCLDFFVSHVPVCLHVAVVL